MQRDKETPLYFLLWMDSLKGLLCAKAKYGYHGCGWRYDNFQWGFRILQSAAESCGAFSQGTAIAHVYYPALVSFLWLEGC